ncbi:hypothetical protein MTO96_018565 [Rhipicephalus appendiculatus]
MAEFNDASSKASCGPRRKPSVLLANLVSARSYFSGSSINYLMPCTSSKGKLCDIFRHLPLWNEYFWQVGLELRELSLGELSLVDVRDPLFTGHTDTYVPHDSPELVHEAATLLYHLLTLHHCVVSVCLNNYIVEGHVQLICDSLRKSSSLTKLRFFRLHMKIQASHSFATTLPHLNHLRELDFSQVHLNQTLLKSISQFLARTTSLKKFVIGHLHSHCDDVAVFLRGLKRNATLTLLSFASCLLRPISYRCGLIFADYLRENKTLDTLYMFSCSQYAFEEVCLVMGALVTNNTLSKLDLFHFCIDDENVQSISRLLCGNQTLRSFNLMNCFLHEPAQPSNASAYMHHIENFGSVSSRIYPWMVALTKNKTLVELTLDLSWFNRNECEFLFKVLASHESLSKIHCHRVQNKDMTETFEALRNTGRQERFSFDMHHVLQDNVAALAACEEMWSVIVDTAVLDGFEPLHRILILLPSCKHVAWLQLVLRPQQFSDTTSSLIATYLTSTTALKEVELLFFGFGTWNAFDRPERALVHALSVNKSLQRLFIQGLCFDETETQILADMLSSSRMVTWLHFYPDDHKSAISLVQKLSFNFSKNYTLLGVMVTRCVELGADWFTVAGVVQRNKLLMTRASLFVMGEEHKYFAAALELVHFTPGLVARVQGLASVDENEAVLRIKESLRSISELDGFMRIAGGRQASCDLPQAR